MDYVWTGIIAVSFVFAAIGGNLDKTLAAGLSGAADSVKVLLSFAGIMCFWSGMLKVAQEGGAAKYCEKLLSPIIRRLFPRVKNRQNITLNVVANMLGMGNAATPAGVSAMCELDAENDSPYPSHEMSRFTVMNTASLSVFPTTVIGLLTMAGEKNPFGVVPLIWISSIVSLISALLAERILCKRGEK